MLSYARRWNGIADIECFRRFLDEQQRSINSEGFRRGWKEKKPIEMVAH